MNSVVTQETGSEFTFELLVVDNNSNDGTRDLVLSYQNRFPDTIRYVFEPRQGRSNALRTGIDMAQGEYVSVVDSDQLMPPRYLQKLFRLFRENRDISIIGGKVLPLWPATPPDWLTTSHWSAVAMCDYGDKAFVIGPDRPLNLLCPGYRVADLRSMGGFRTGLSVSKGQIGGVEDTELMQRMLFAGFKALYEPSLCLQHKAEPERLTRAYHRRWHRGHGRFYAIWREPAFERSRFKVAGIPVHMFRSVAQDTFAWLSALARGGKDAFEFETRLHFSVGFVLQRLRQQRSHQPAEGEQ